MFIKYAEVEKLSRIKNELLIFRDSNYTMSDREIAEEMLKRGFETSSSTVGRDLTSSLLRKVTTPLEYDMIQEMRKLNKLVGCKKGGVVSTTKNEFIKDKDGKFIGNKTRCRIS